VRTRPPCPAAAGFLALGLLASAGPSAAAPPEKGRAAVPLSVEKVEYRGWSHNLKIANGKAELVVTLDVGPRVISYRTAGGANVFKNYDGMMGKAGEGEWMIRGGHRLWAAPEDTTRTYAADNGPVAYQELGPGEVRFTPAPEAEYGLQKVMELKLEPDGTKVTARHRITNVGKEETRLAVWALSVMAPGGVEVIPLPPHAPHPGSPKNARSAADFAPSLLMVAWPFTDFTDPRLRLGSKFITLTQDPQRGPTKFGLAHRAGGVGYLNGGTLFVKRFDHREGQHYPDHGSNFETFTNQDMVEIESLGPLTRLAPGQSVDHAETWELFDGLGAATTEAEIEAEVAPKLK